MGAPFPGARVSFAWISSSARVEASMRWGVSVLNAAFCSGVAGASILFVNGIPELFDHGAIMFAGVLPGGGCNFGRKQVQDDAVFIRCPDGTVLA